MHIYSLPLPSPPFLLTCLKDGGKVPGHEVSESEQMMLRLLHRTTLAICSRHLLEKIYMYVYMYILYIRTLYIIQ